MPAKKAKTFDVFKSEVFYPAIDAALARICTNGRNREPCYTAALAEELPKILNDTMDEAAKKTGVPPRYRFGSCYVHQKPYVRFGPGFRFRRELGDLLVLVKKSINGVDAFNSALFQLKKTDDKPKLIIRAGSGEEEQLTLYTKWGPLEIDLKTERGVVYDITPHAVSLGGLYMLIRAERKPKFVVAVPDREMNTKPPPSIGCYLSDMVKWHCGRTLATKSDVMCNDADDWSKLIWKVIDLLKDAVSKCKGYGNGSVRRDNGCGSLAFMRDCPELPNFGESENEDSASNDGTGFGVVFIEELDNCSEHREVRR